MARARKRHIQAEMFNAKGDKPKGTRGGKRRGAGRPPKGDRAGSPHKRRPKLEARFPVHVVMRVAREVGSLRKRHMYAALREATIAVAKRELNFAEDGAFRIVHISIQRTHVHMIVEASHKMALSRGMQSFQISAAKHINRAASSHREQRRRGCVFVDRFHQEIITTPTQARHSLSYVLNNWRKHQEDRSPSARSWKVDPYSTGLFFTGWKEREGEIFFWKWRVTYHPLIVYRPRTWLLNQGWRLKGLISYAETPRTTQKIKRVAPKHTSTQNRALQVRPARLRRHRRHRASGRSSSQAAAHRSRPVHS